MNAQLPKATSMDRSLGSVERAGFADPATAAIDEFDVADAPVTVALSSDGSIAHITGPRTWATKIGWTRVAVA